jgi:hypothetical protein
MSGLTSLIIAVAVLLVAWWITQRFSPDPLLTKIVQVIIFVIALVLVIRLVMPMAGLAF